jgi:hypothetical protein
MYHTFCFFLSTFLLTTHLKLIVFPLVSIDFFRVVRKNLPPPISPAKRVRRPSIALTFLSETRPLTIHHSHVMCSAAQTQIISPPPPPFITRPLHPVPSRSFLHHSRKEWLFNSIVFLLEPTQIRLHIPATGEIRTLMTHVMMS